VASGWRRLHNEKLHNLYAAPNIIRMIKSKKMRWVTNIARTKEKINACRILIGKSEEKRPLGRTRRSWEDNIRVDPKEVGWKSVDWIHLAMNRDQWWVLVNKVMNLPVP
jgi:hypothetical protein